VHPSANEAERGDDAVQTGVKSFPDQGLARSYCSMETLAGKRRIT